MLKILPVSLLSISFVLTVCAQYNPGAKQISLANSDVSLAIDVFSIFSNPAGLSQIRYREIGLYYSPAPFGFTELANGFLAYNEPFSFGAIGIGVMTYGFELYRENKFTAAFSYNYENKFYTGVSLNYHTVSIKKYGSTGAFYADIGSLIYLTEFFRLGFFIHNINRATFGNYKDQIPLIFKTGVSFDILNNLSLCTAIEKDIRYNASISAGFDYRVIEYFSLRTGFSNEPSRYTAGIGINYSLIELDYAVFTHPDLGLTHQAGLIISFGSEESK